MRRRGFLYLLVISVVLIATTSFDYPFKFGCVSSNFGDDGPPPGYLDPPPLNEALAESEAVFLAEDMSDRNGADRSSNDWYGSNYVATVTEVYRGRVSANQPVWPEDNRLCDRDVPGLYVATDKAQIASWTGPARYTVYIYELSPENLDLVHETFGNKPMATSAQRPQPSLYPLRTQIGLVLLLVSLLGLAGDPRRWNRSESDHSPAALAETSGPLSDRSSPTT